MTSEQKNKKYSELAKTHQPAKNCLVLGAGNFGTCLAQHLALQGNKVTLWARSAEIVDAINQTHRNPRYLSTIMLSKDICATTKISDELISGLDAIILATPTQSLRQVLVDNIKNRIQPHVLLVCAAKGIEIDTLKLPLEIIADVLGETIAESAVVLSGPSFASEVSQNIPTAVTVAGRWPGPTIATQKLFHSPYFRVYSSSDPAGLEVAGALKNVIAIAAGACLGMGFQNNSLAALITRGLAEITRVGVAVKANPITFIGLGGVGDLFLTCTSDKSRNYSVGFKLGEGKPLEQALKEVGSVAEGVTTAKAAYLLIKKFNIEAAIIDEIYQVLYENKPVKDAVHDLLHRQAKAEFT